MIQELITRNEIELPLGQTRCCNCLSIVDSCDAANVILHRPETYYLNLDGLCTSCLFAKKHELEFTDVEIFCSHVDGPPRVSVPMKG